MSADDRARPLDARPACWPITETAGHAGHLDAARELIDGRQHLLLTG